MVGYIEYLQYWQQPEYAKFILYPWSLHFLRLLTMVTLFPLVKHPLLGSLPSCFRQAAVRRFTIRTHHPPPQKEFRDALQNPEFKDALRDQQHRSWLHYQKHRYSASGTVGQDGIEGVKRNAS